MNKCIIETLIQKFALKDTVFCGLNHFLAPNRTEKSLFVFVVMGQMDTA